tara:strand:- start:41393 stop:44095 length:2703 start_codon:yes stop_codon:yes gene_type:complete
MKKIIILFITVFSIAQLRAQIELSFNNRYQEYYQEAYEIHPQLPKGLLEAQAYVQSRNNHLVPSPQTQSCIGLPEAFTVFGLIEDGKGYFKNNLQFVSQLSGYSVSEIKNSPRMAILAYAEAIYQLSLQNGINSSNPEDYIGILEQLSFLPNNDPGQNYALNLELFEIYRFLNNPDFQSHYQLPSYTINMENLFGKDNLKVLSASKVTLNGSLITSNTGQQYQSVNHNKLSPDYPPGIWDPAPSCNYSSRSGTPISAVTIHTIQGTYAGAISWAKNCNSNVSYHYVLRSSDGQVTQMVYESDKAWHVGSANPYTIGLEHEGYVTDPSWYTVAMYQGSADVVRDICASGYGISNLRTAYFPWASTTHYNQSSIPGSCVQIKGHQHFPNQTHTDPDQYWDWKYYDNLINQSTSVTTLTNASGTITDAGGSAGNYPDDERQLILIQPPNASQITLTTVNFDLENTWDYLYIYDGATVNDPVIGYYTGTSIPATITSTGGSLLLEMRSDCATNNPGFEFNYTSTAPDAIPPTTQISPIGTVSSDFTATFTDADNTGGSGVNQHFYQVIDYNGFNWYANDSNGFFSDNFDSSAIAPHWTTYTGTWSINNNYLEQSDEVLANTNISAYVNQTTNNEFLYHWAGKISGSGTNKRAGFHFMCDDASLTNRGNSYFVWFREDDDKVQIYEVVNDAFTLVKDKSYTFNPNQWYDFKVTYDKTSGRIDIYIDNVYVDGWTDSTPLTAGNYVSFRSGNCIYTLNNLKIYHDRGPTALVTVGPGYPNDIRYQSNPSTQPAGKVKSIVIDAAKNLSAIDIEDVYVQWITSVDELLNKYNITVYPNPTADLITVKGKTISVLRLTDVQNKLIIEQSANQTGINTLNVQKLPSGTYLLYIFEKNSGKNIPVKIIKK